MGGQTQAHMFNNNVNCYHAFLPYESYTTPLQVGYLREPGLFLMDMMLEKDFKLPWREGMYLEFDADAYDLMNHPNFMGRAPNTNFASPPVNEPQIGWTGFGTYTQTESNTPEIFTLVLRLFF